MVLLLMIFVVVRTMFLGCFYQYFWIWNFFSYLFSGKQFLNSLLCIYMVKTVSISYLQGYKSVVFLLSPRLHLFVQVILCYCFVSYIVNLNGQTWSILIFLVFKMGVYAARNLFGRKIGRKRTPENCLREKLCSKPSSYAKSSIFYA